MFTNPSHVSARDWWTDPLRVRESCRTAGSVIIEFI
jgi:hypothetical protein